MATIREPRIKFIPAKWIFTSAVLIIALTVLTVYLTGFTSSRSILKNTAISLTVISVLFFVFLTTSLYHGIKLKDDLGNLTKKIKWIKETEIAAEIPVDLSSEKDSSGTVLPDLDLADGSDEIAAVIFAWVAITFTFIALFFLLEHLILAFVLLLAAMLYWIFLRAVRLVLKNSLRCKGKLIKSALYGFGYTLLYSSWLYGILFSVRFLK